VLCISRSSRLGLKISSDCVGKKRDRYRISKRVSEMFLRIPYSSKSNRPEAWDDSPIFLEATVAGNADQLVLLGHTEVQA
jgi:hypothetical protein